MNDDADWAKYLLKSLNIEALSRHRLRRLANNNACYGFVLDYQLTLQPISIGRAQCFIARHHRHCGPPVGWRFGISVFKGDTLLGVATIGNPVAPRLYGQGIVEVNRLCIRRDTPDALPWNAASMLYGWCARGAEKRGWRKIITYTRADERGTSLHAAGWVREAGGRGWHSARRSRSNQNGWIDKSRWSRTLAPIRPTSHNQEKPSRHGFMSTEPMMDESAFAWQPASVPPPVKLFTDASKHFAM